MGSQQWAATLGWNKIKLIALNNRYISRFNQHNLILLKAMIIENNN